MSGSLFNLNDFANEAQSIVSAAQRQADEMIASCRADIELEKEKAKKEGYAKGFEEGQKEGYEKGLKDGCLKGEEDVKKQTAFLAQNLENIFKTFDALKSDILQRSEVDLLRLSLAVAEKIVKVKAEREPEIVLENFKIALRFTNAKSNLNIFVNPLDKEIISKSLHKFNQFIETLHTIKVIDSDEIERGGCLIKTPDGDINQTIQKQIDMIYQNLLNGKASTDVPESE